uniref:BLTX593 n=1 Tax=Nephila pilipes TaxID=299642 RepID=A0A076KZZ3_NEPPI|nr:BLTX593 [Nephila pilipes]
MLEYCLIPIAILISSTIAEPDGFCRYFCVSDSQGANCTKDGSPWISCSNENQFFYKGDPLTKDSLDGADDEICKTADRAFNDLFVQNLSADNATAHNIFGNGWNSFFKEMFNMQQRLLSLQDKILGMFGPGFPFGTDGSRTFDSDGSDYETGVDQVEKE